MPDQFQPATLPGDRSGFDAWLARAARVLPLPYHFFCSTPPEAFFRPDRASPRPSRAGPVKAAHLRAPIFLQVGAWP